MPGREEEIVSGNILPELIAFMEGPRFTRKLDTFIDQHGEIFVISINDTQCNEWNHQHKDIFDQFQDILEEIFSEFAENNHTTIQFVFNCCRDAGKQLSFVTINHPFVYFNILSS